METILFRTLRTIFPIQLLPFFLLFGCLASEGEFDEFDTSDDEEVASEIYAIMVDVDPESLEPTITLPDGSVTHSFDEYADSVFEIYETAPNAEIEIEFGENLNAMVSFELNPDDSDDRWGPYYIWSYVLTGGMHYNYYIGSCIQRSVNHYDVRVHQNSVQLIGLHVAFWTQNGSLCYGVYNAGTVGGFCRTGCTPTYTQVVYAIRDAFVVIGLSVTTAYIIAQIVTPVAIGVMGVAL